MAKNHEMRPDVRFLSRQHSIRAPIYSYSAKNSRDASWKLCLADERLVIVNRQKSYS